MFSCLPAICRVHLDVHDGKAIETEDLQREMERNICIKNFSHAISFSCVFVTLLGLLVKL